jgi:type IV pilus assembly protein PilC
MAIFMWTAQTRSGEKKSGELEASGPDAVAIHLKNMGLVPGKVKEKPKDLAEIFPFLAAKVTIKDLVIFTRQFAVMVDAGLPLVQCLQILAEQQPNVTFKAVLRNVKSSVEQGSTFADALRKHPKVFDDLFTNLIAAGEVGGILDTILNRLAIQLEKQEKLRKQLKGAMVYPATVSVIAIACIVLLLVKVIPVFEQMFADFGGTLPGPTQMVINLSKWMQSYIVYAIAGTVAAFTAFARARAKSAAFRYKTDQIALQLPIFGNIIKKVAVARFTRTLGTLVSAGIPILSALKIVRDTLGNAALTRAVDQVSDKVTTGQSLADPLERSGHFPPLLIQIVNIGERSGRLEQMLLHAAGSFDRQVNNSLKIFTRILPTILLIVMALVASFVLAAILLPIIELQKAVV